MTSYAHQTLPAKRIKKLAAQLTDDEVRASLGEDERNHAYIDMRNGQALVGLWTASSGPMTMMDDDSVRVYAQIDFMRRHGYPSFRSDDELSAYAKANGWSRRTAAKPAGPA